MPSRRAHLTRRTEQNGLAAALSELRTESGVPVGFPAEVLAEAEAAHGGPLPDLDLRGIAFVTLDPEGSQDLDQAFCIEPAPAGDAAGGYVLRYAIADVPSFVRPGGAIDLEARRRGQTLYLPDGLVPLHPPILSEDRVSLHPTGDRTAYVWTIPVDASGAAEFEGGAAAPARVERALVRSRARLDYAAAQREIDAESAREQVRLLREFGLLRIAQEHRRGGASLSMPDEEIVCDDSGYRIERRSPLPVEEWNAQLSLLTGMAAARIMLDGGIGILRTMPAPEAETLAEFKVRVRALGLPWPERTAYGDYLRDVPRDTAQGLAVLHAAASLFRGAGYTVFDAGGTVSAEDAVQSAIAAPYAHVTAPLRRLVDRWGLVICEALCSGSPVPEWARASLGDLPALMRASSSLAGRIGGEALDRVEAALLHDRIGDVVAATVLEVRGSRARLQIADPPITASAEPVPERLAPGTEVSARVVSADVPSGRLALALA
ncbi:RNB domain-containing ribonuclease [Leucobacter sp. gxy201]|uniref:RNB domain-containing ribonuclease n=1 Tax=Leucobacter sp. gxy201 TaxID=2957200 RepID=UPI003D9FBBBC